MLCRQWLSIHPKVARPKSGDFWSRINHWPWIPPGTNARLPGRKTKINKYEFLAPLDKFLAKNIIHFITNLTFIVGSHTRIKTHALPEPKCLTSTVFPRGLFMASIYHQQPTATMHGQLPMPSVTADFIAKTACLFDGFIYVRFWTPFIKLKKIKNEFLKIRRKVYNFLFVFFQFQHSNFIG